MKSNLSRHRNILGNGNVEGERNERSDNRTSAARTILRNASMEPGEKRTLELAIPSRNSRLWIYQLI